MKEYNIDKMWSKAERYIEAEKEWVERYKEREDWEEFIRAKILVQGMELMFDEIFADNEDI